MKKEGVLIFLVISIAFISIFLYIGPFITGYAVYDVNFYSWDFTNSSDYVYENVTVNSLVTLANITEQVNVTFILEASLISATYNDQDVLDKLTNLTTSHLTMNKEDFVELVFNDSLTSNYRINLNLLNFSEDIEIYFCEHNENCTFPGYGGLKYNNVEGWYYVTLENLTEPKSRLRLISVNKTKINYLAANYSERISVDNVSYYSGGFIESKDILIEGDSILMRYNSTGLIDYYYSMDSGLIWSTFTTNQTFNLTSNSLRFKAFLNENEIMPELRSVDVYTQEAQQEQPSQELPSAGGNTGESSGGGSSGGGGNSGGIVTPNTETSKNVSTSTLEQVQKESSSDLNQVNMSLTNNETTILAEPNFEKITGKSVREIIDENVVYILPISLIILILISLLLKYYKKKNNKLYK